MWKMIFYILVLFQLYHAWIPFLRFKKYHVWWICDINTDIWLFSYLQPRQDVSACRWCLAKNEETEICRLYDNGNEIKTDERMSKQKKETGQKAPCDWEVWYTTKGATERAWALSWQVCPACVALNIVVFVYRAYNSHAKGTVLF